MSLRDIGGKDMKKYLTKEGIISGIIASVLFTFMLQPVIEFLVSKAGSVVEGLERYVISQCAKTTYISLMTGFATILISCILGLALGVLFSNRTIKKRENNKNKNSAKKEDELAVLQEEIVKKNTEVNDIEKRLGFFKITMSIVVILWLGMLFVTYILPSRMYSDFVVSVEKISPYISETDIISLKARWREMGNWTDYEAIEEYIKTIETKQR